MNVPLMLGAMALMVVVFGVVAEFRRSRARSRRRRRRYDLEIPKRRPQLERQMLAAFQGPRDSYGECFSQYSIRAQFEIIRMDLSTAGPWEALNAFTRSLIVRHLWGRLAHLSKSGVVVYVDAGAPDAMVWTKESTEQFNDCGIQDPWSPAKGRAGTLLSGR